MILPVPLGFRTNRAIVGVEDMMTTLENEADVETQYIIPFLTSSEKLGIPLELIRSKKTIVPKEIGKGSNLKKRYVPDFTVYKFALPVLVIEAKCPGINIDNAYREAQLYAHAINSSFPEGVNPCARLFVTNGDDVHAGYWDAKPALSCTVSDLTVGSSELSLCIQICGVTELEEIAANVNEKLRSRQFARPFNQGAGPTWIASKIQPNTFAADLTPVLRRYFSSRDQTEDPRIYERAYISSDEITGYDRILESYLKDRISKAKGQTQIKTSKKRSDELTKAINRFNRLRPISGDLQLITGGVGSGKSLFARRYKEFLQPSAIKEKNHWAFLNFNLAPPDREDWSSWVFEAFVTSFRDENLQIDLSDAATQEAVFAPNLADRSAFYMRMEQAQLGRGVLERARDLEQWRQDARATALALSRYIQGDRGENLIVVFDNVDRRNSEDQLHAFETALWFMDQTRCLVLLQMRDATFEKFKNEPPLDTYKTGQIFHIVSPRFTDVVKRRLELALEEFSEEVPEEVTFVTSKGITITYPSTRAAEYLRGVYLELFQGVRNSSRILASLAGRDVRRALDMFMALISSGHIPEETIASVARGHGFHLPEFRILRALMRQDYRFFNEGSGFVANIFYAESSWKRPNILLTPEILFFLVSQRRVPGDNGQVGYVALQRLIIEMEYLGFVEDDIRSSLEYLLRKELIEADSSVVDELRQGDCFKSTASGWAHMRLLSSRMEYVVSVLPTTPIDDLGFRSQIFEALQLENSFGTISLARQVTLTKAFLDYLKVEDSRQRVHPGYLKLRPFGSTYIIEKIEDALRFARRETNAASGQGDLLDR